MQDMGYLKKCLHQIMVHAGVLYLPASFHGMEDCTGAALLGFRIYAANYREAQYEHTDNDNALWEF
jgi:hypothetical protein